MQNRSPRTGRIFHVSDRPDLDRFEPRIAPTDPRQRAVAWAVDEDHLGHYLVPRECPRVCFRAGPDSTAHDVGSLLGGDPTARVVAVEEGWKERIASSTLYRYEFDPGPFQLIDPIAGYFTSDRAVDAIDLVTTSDLPAELARLGYTFLALPSLHELRDQVITSTLPFSVIRWRNADQRTGTDGSVSP